MSPEKERKVTRSRSAGASKGSGGAKSQRARGTSKEPRGKLRTMLEYEGVTRSKGAKQPEKAQRAGEKRPQPSSKGKSKLRAIFEYEGVTRQEARTKEALRESEQKLRVIFDSIAAGITITDIEGNIVEMNSGALRLHGFSSKDKVIGRSGLDLIAKKDHQRAFKNWMARFKDKEPKQVSDHYTLLKADGSEFEAAVSEALLRDKHGEPEGFISIARDITESKRAEELVRASEAKLRAMFDSIEDAVTIVDLEGNILQVNDVMCRMSGYSREELIGKSGWDIIDPEYRDTMVNDLLKQIKGEAPKEALAYKFSTPDGREYYAELHVSVIRDGSGKATGFLTIHNDVTERRRMQEALRESEEMARGMLESAATGIYLAQDKVFQYVSPLFVEISGYASNELIGTNPLEYVHPEDRENVRKKAIENLKGRSSLPHEFRFMRKDGEAVWILEKVASIEYGGKPAAIASFMDITEQKRAEAELEKSMEKLRIIIESIGDMLFVTDLELNFVNVNDSAVRSLGYSKEEELIGKSAVDCIAEKDRSRVAVDMGKALATQSGVETIEYTLLTADGSEVDAESNIDILRDCSGQVVGLIITTRDITERKRMQESVRASEEKLRIMFESIRDGIAVTDPLGIIVEVNEATAAMTGYPKEKLIGMSGLELISPEYHQMAAEVMGKVMEGEQATASLELKFITADGGEVDAEFSTSMLYDGDGNATGFVSIARDIRERKQMEAELEKSAEKLRLVIESIGDMLFITDLDLNFSNVNEAAVRQLGYASQEELAGRNAMEPVIEEDRTRVAIELGKALAEERGIEIIEYSLQAVDGRKFDVEANAEILRDCSGMVVGLIISARDVTERKRMQEAISNSEEKLRGIFDTIPDGVTFTDMYGTILELNEAMVQLYGHTNKEELIGRNAVDFVAEGYRDTVVLLGMNAIKEGHNIERIEYRLVNAAGEEFDAEFYSAPLRDSSGEPVAWVNVSRDITERKKAERAVRESEQRFRVIFESIVDGLTVTDLNGNIVDMNEAALQLHRYSDKQALIGKNTIEYLVAEADRERTINEALQAIKEDRPLERAEYRLQREDGTEFDGEFSTAILRDDSGKATGHIGMTRDITERKQAEEAVRESEQKLRLIFENIGDGITLSDLEGKIIDINEAAVLKGGYSSKEELIGRNGFEMVSPEDRERVTEGVVQVLKEGRSTARLECRFTTATGGEYDADLSISALRDSSGKLTAFIALSRDITERKKAEEALRQSEEKLRLTFEAIGDALTVTDLEGNILEVNELAYSKAGYSSKEEFIGTNGFDLVSPEDRDRITKTIVQTMKEGLSSATMECTFHPIKGDDYDAELTFSVIRDTSGNPTGFIATSRDITERKRAEEAIRQSEEKLNRMFASMSEGIIVTDMAGIFLDVNDALLRISGYSRKEDLIGKSALDLVAPEEHEKIIGAFTEKLDPENIDKMMDYEIYTFLAPDGSKREAEFTGNLMHDGDGNPVGFIGVVHDISERRQAEEAIRASEEKLRLMFESMRDAIVLTDTTGTIVEVNDAAVIMHGYSSRDEIIGRNGLDLVAESDRKKVAEAAIKQSKGEIQEGITEHHMLLRADGTEFESESSRAILRDAEGNTTGFIAVERDITERKRAEEALEESESRFRELFENMSSAVAVYEVKNNGKDFIFTDFNSAGERISQLKKEDILGKNLVDVFPNIKKGGIYQAMKRVWKSGKPEYIPPAFYKDDRISGWRENYIYKLPTGEVIAVYDDVTERMRAEEAVRQSEEKLRTMFDSTNDAFIVTDVEINVIDVNEATLRMFRYTREDIIGIKGTELIDPKDLERTVESMSKSLETGQPPDRMDLTILTGDGGKLETDFSIAPLHDSSGNTTGFVVIARDITERKRTEAAMRESEEKLRMMFESTSDGILVTDQALSIVQTNEAAARILGFDSKEELVGQSAIPYMSTATRGADDEDSDDGKVQIEFSVSQLRDSSGNTTGFIGVARDVTERRKAEARMKRMLEDLERSNAELEQFAYIASHDLQEPLRMVSSYTQLLERRYKGKLEADADEFIEYAVDGATRMQDRIQALLTYSRVGTRGKEFEPTDCESVLEQALANLQVAIKKKEAVITHDPLPTIPADDIQMVQLFQNLIDNGIKFCEEKQPQVHISAMEQEEDWTFSFRDNGIGIEPQYSERIFLIFKKLHGKGEYAGTGVGLALCKKIVERHGGRIWVESDLGKGATFCFTVPKERKEEDNE